MTLAIAKEKRQILLSFNRWKDCSLASFDYDLLKCIFRKNRALAPHERSAVPLGTDHCPVGYTAIFFRSLLRYARLIIHFFFRKITSETASRKISSEVSSAYTPTIPHFSR